MVEALKVSDIITKCKSLKDFWSTRNTQMKEWYDMLLLTNNLSQPDMESVIVNEPAVAYRLGLHLLTSSIIAHQIPTEPLERPEMVDTSSIEKFITLAWKKQDKAHRAIGKQSWLSELTRFMLATGWYSVFTWATKDRLIAEIWNPAEVFPRFSRDPEIGLDECVHIYGLTAPAANRKAKLNGWSLPNPFRSDTTVYSYFMVDDDGDIETAVIMGSILVVPLHKLVRQEQISTRIPILISPVGGLPDTGIIETSGTEWQKHYGESIIASAMDVINNRNKMSTYIQQLVRDTANPRWFERSTSSRGILRPEDIFKRGQIFRGSPNESIDVLPVPPIPVEVRTILFDYDSMIQRALFPYALYGNIQTQMSGYMMSQIASSAMSVLTPYAEAIQAVLSGVDNYWLTEVRERKLKTYKFEFPKNAPEDIEFEVKLNINIPGNLIQRATVGKMLDPNLKFDFGTTCDLLFPEIVDPIQVQGKVNKDEAMMSPIAQTVAMVEAYREVAMTSREEGNIKTAELYEKAATALEAQIAPPQAQVPSTQPPPRQREVREAAPREETTPPEEMM